MHFQNVIVKNTETPPCKKEAQCGRKRPQSCTNRQEKLRFFKTQIDSNPSVIQIVNYLIVQCPRSHVNTATGLLTVGRGRELPHPRGTIKGSQRRSRVKEVPRETQHERPFLQGGSLFLHQTSKGQTTSNRNLFLNIGRWQEDRNPL